MGGTHVKKIDWARKLSSRKLWAMIAGFIAGLMIYFGGDPERANATEGLIMSMASIIVYICAEAATDSAHSDEEDE